MNETQFDKLVTMVQAIANATAADYMDHVDTTRAQEDRHEAIVEASTELVDYPDDPQPIEIQKPTAEQYICIAKALAQGLAGTYILPGSKSFDEIVSGFTASLMEENRTLDVRAFYDSVATQAQIFAGTLTEGP